MIRNRIVGVLISIFLIVSTERIPVVRAGIEDYYRNLFQEKFGLAVGSPPVKEAGLVFPGEPSFSSREKPTPKESTLSLVSPIEFVLPEPADYFQISFSLNHPYQNGSLILAKREKNDFRVVFSSALFVADVYVNNDFGQGEFRLSFGSGDQSKSEIVLTKIKAFRYQTKFGDYEPSDFVVFLSSRLGYLGSDLESILRQRRSIIVCDSRIPVEVLGNRCSFDEIAKGSPSDLSPIQDEAGQNLMVVPFWNRGSVLLTPRVFWQDSSVSFLSDYFSASVKKKLFNFSFSGEFGRSVLDFYRLMVLNSWFLYGILVFFVLFFFQRYNPRLRGIEWISLPRSFVFAVVNLFLSSIRRGRLFFLAVFFLSSFWLLALFASKNLALFFKASPSVRSVYFSLRNSLGFGLSFSDLRSLFEAAFLSLAVLALAVAFLDKLLIIFYGFISPLIRFSRVSAKTYSQFILVWLLAFSLTLFLVGNPVTNRASALILIFLLLVLELRLLLAERGIAFGGVGKKWLAGYFLAVFLVLLATASQRFRPSISVPIFEKERIVDLNDEEDRQVVGLPGRSVPILAHERYADFYVEPLRPLFADDYLIGYPKAERIIYAKTNGYGRSDLNSKKVTLYLMRRDGRPPSITDSLSLLKNFLVNKQLDLSTSQPQEVGLPEGYEPLNGRMVFYLYLPAGSSSLNLQYLDLNLSPRPRTFLANVYSLSGEPVFSSTNRNSDFFSVQVPSYKTISQELTVKKSGLYVVEIFLDDRPLILSLNDQAFLTSAVFPTQLIYFLNPDSLFVYDKNYRKPPVSFNYSSFNPFIFDLVGFGGEADAALVSNDRKDFTSLNSSRGDNIGPVLNNLAEADPKLRQGSLIHYLGEDGPLFVNKPAE